MKETTTTYTCDLCEAPIDIQWEFSLRRPGSSFSIYQRSYSATLDLCDQCGLLLIEWLGLKRDEGEFMMPQAARERRKLARQS